MKDRAAQNISKTWCEPRTPPLQPFARGEKELLSNVHWSLKSGGLGWSNRQSWPVAQ